ncbi:hypothetical protein KSF78_0003333 [Schistosoma japonicum]|nr:hypothetical protein KSF78_0003333 [Schistosoma japonicum]
MRLVNMHVVNRRPKNEEQGEATCKALYRLVKNKRKVGFTPFMSKFYKCRSSLRIVSTFDKYIIHSCLMTYNHVRSKPFMACDPSKEEKRNINTVSSLSTLSDEVIKYVMSVYRKEVIVSDTKITRFHRSTSDFKLLVKLKKAPTTGSVNPQKYELDIYELINQSTKQSFKFSLNKTSWYKNRRFSPQFLKMFGLVSYSISVEVRRRWTMPALCFNFNLTNSSTIVSVSIVSILLSSLCVFTEFSDWSGTGQSPDIFCHDKKKSRECCCYFATRIQVISTIWEAKI